MSLYAVALIFGLPDGEVGFITPESPIALKVTELFSKAILLPDCLSTEIAWLCANWYFHLVKFFCKFWLIAYVTLVVGAIC